MSEKFLNAHLACHSDNVFLLRGLEPCNNVIYRYHIEYQVITRSYILFFERRESKKGKGSLLSTSIYILYKKIKIFSNFILMVGVGGIEPPATAL